MFYVLVQGKGKKLQGSPSLVTTVGYSLHLGVVVVVVVVVIGFVFLIFWSQNVTPLMNINLNSGFSFIKQVDCGREVSKEAHKVLIKIKKIVDF